MVYEKSYLWVAVTDMCHIVDAVQIVIAVCVIQPTPLPSHNVQRPLVDQRCVGANVRFPLCHHCVILHVIALRMQARDP